MFRFVEWFDHADPVGKFGSANLKDAKIFSRGYTESKFQRTTPDLKFFSFNIFDSFKKLLAEVLWVSYFIVLGSKSDQIFSHTFNMYSYI